MYILSKAVLLIGILLLLAFRPPTIYAQDGNKKPYIIHSKTAHISSVEVRRKKGSINNISIQLTHSNAGSTFSITPSADTLNSGKWFTIPPPELTHVRVIEGVYSSLQRSQDNRRYTINTLYQVQFPFRMKIEISDQNLEIEFKEAGNWGLNVTLDNIYNPDLLVTPSNH